MKRCPQCNKIFPDAERFCDDDGSALVAGGGPATTRVDEAPGPQRGQAGSEQPVECPVCGGKAEPGEIICNFCGARLDAPAAPPQQPVRPTPSASLRSPGPGSTGTARVEHTFPDERPAGQDEEPPRGRGWIGIIGYTIAALVALIGGAWLALHLTKSSNAPVAEASPAVATGAPTPAAATAPTVTLASTIPTQVSGPAAGAPERNRDAIEKVFDGNRAALADIYTRTLDTDSTAHDGMLIHLSVDPSGKVSASSIKTSTAPNPSLDAEVLNSIGDWDFGPSSAGAVEADLPIIFAHGPTEASATESALSTKLAALSPSEPPEYAVAAASPTAMPTPPAVAALPPPPPVEAAPKPRRHRTRVASAPPPRPTLLEKVQDRLRVDPRTRRVKVYTNSGGVVTLYGKVFDDKARRIAINNVRGVSGVTDVIDNLRTDTGEWQQQQDAITRQLQGAGLTGVTVKVIGKDAFLDGEVKTALDRERAVTIAEGAAPVKVRTNLIRVAPGSVFGF